MLMSLKLNSNLLEILCRLIQCKDSLIVHLTHGKLDILKIQFGIPNFD